MNNHAENNQESIQKLGERSVNHLKMEADVLRQFISVCNSIRDSLGRQQEDQAEWLKKEQSRIEQDSRSLNQERVDLRQAIADSLGRPLEATSVKALEDRLTGPVAADVAQLRAEIETLVAEIQELSRTNAVLLQHNIDIFHRMLLSLNGQEKCQTYSPKGTLNSSKIQGLVSVSNQ